MIAVAFVGLLLLFLSLVPVGLGAWGFRQLRHSNLAVAATGCLAAGLAVGVVAAFHTGQAMAEDPTQLGPSLYLDSTEPAVFTVMAEPTEIDTALTDRNFYRSLTRSGPRPRIPLLSSDTAGRSCLPVETLIVRSRTGDTTLATVGADPQPIDPSTIETLQRWPQGDCFSDNTALTWTGTDLQATDAPSDQNQWNVPAWAAAYTMAMLPIAVGALLQRRNRHRRIDAASR